MKYKIIIAISVLIIIFISVYFLLINREDQFVFDEKFISEKILENSDVKFDTVEILNYKEGFAKVKLTDSSINSINYAFFREESENWKLDLIASADVGYACADLESVNYPNQMIVDCKVGLNNSISVSEFLNKETLNAETVSVSGKLFLGEDPNCNCAIITDGSNEIEITFGDNNSEINNNIKDGEIVVVDINTQNLNNIKEDQIVVSSNNVNVVSNLENNSQDFSQDKKTNSSLSDYNPSPSIQNNNSYMGGFLDRNYSDIPIKIIGDEGSF